MPYRTVRGGGRETIIKDNEDKHYRISFSEQHKYVCLLRMTEDNNTIHSTEVFLLLLASCRRCIGLHCIPLIWRVLVRCLPTVGSIQRPIDSIGITIRVHHTVSHSWIAGSLFLLASFFDSKYNVPYVACLLRMEYSGTLRYASHVRKQESKPVRRDDASERNGIQHNRRLVARPCVRPAAVCSIDRPRGQPKHRNTHKPPTSFGNIRTVR